MNFARYIDPSANKDSLPIRQIPLTSEGIPDVVRHAITGAEDRRFFGTSEVPAHFGCAPLNIARRVVLSGGEDGGSVLGQQALKLRSFRGAGHEFWDDLFTLLVPKCGVS
ncbi:MAG: transglycosylase domain-containing protein [Acidobacteria bacterium]|nr:transglycosylase domain-containing protein [Acidobacteriota bacterium]